MVSQSAKCFKSSAFGFGGKNVGLVLLITLSSILGPIERATLCLPETAELEAASEADEEGVGTDAEDGM